MKDKNLNDFRQHLKMAVITNVNAQEKTIDIEYLGQFGTYLNLALPSTNSGSTWGGLNMPVKGDKVMLDNTLGGRPIVIGMYPQNTDLLPYMDPGEVGHSSSNGSFMGSFNAKKRVISTGVLVDYDATVGPNGETDLALQPGGVVVKARSRKNQNANNPSYYDHSYLSLYDNGDIALESNFQNKNKALLHFDGASGHAWLHAGDGKAQEYLELNPIKKEVVLYSDGDIHFLALANNKNVFYQNKIDIFGGVYQLSTGIPSSSIGTTGSTAYFDSITTSLNPGDMLFNVTNQNNPSGGQVNWNVAQGFQVYTMAKNLNMLTSGGPGPNGSGKGTGAILIQTLNDSLTIQAGLSTITINVSGAITITANTGPNGSSPNISVINNSTSGNIIMSTTGGGSILMQGGSPATPLNRIATLYDIVNHGHATVPATGSLVGGVVAPPSTGYTSGSPANGFIGNI